MRRVARNLGVVVTVVAALLAAAASSAQARPTPADPATASAASLRVRLLTLDQSDALAREALRVRVTSRRRGTVRLTATVRRAGNFRGARRSSATLRLRRERTRFRRGGTRTILLDLSARARRLLASCTPQTVAVTARVGRRRASTSVRLRRDTETCVSQGLGDPPAGGGTGGGGQTGGGTAPGGSTGTGSAGGGSTGGTSGGGTTGGTTGGTSDGGSTGGGTDGASDGGSTGGTGGGSTGGTDGSTGGGPPQEPGFSTANSNRCDFLDDKHCLFPWPNDHFTRADATSATGKRVNLDIQSMPRNRANKPIDPTDYNLNDGFSPGAKIVTHVPGMDNQAAFDATDAVPITDLERAFDEDQPVVLINARTKRRHLIWAEMDANPPDDANRHLIIRPGVNFDEGTRYIVALRKLRDREGNEIPVRRPFQVYRDRIVTTDPAVEGRREHFEDIFSVLGEAGIPREDLYLAWDFTTASGLNLAGRMLHIRDDAFAQLGDTNLADLQVQGTAPQFIVDRITNNPDPRIARQIEGHFLVPCYLDKPGCPAGSRFVLNPLTGMPVRNPGNFHEARFRCAIPNSAVKDNQVTPARASLYGHGLLGSRAELGQGQLRDFGNEHNMVFCATEWAGMACGDVPSPPTNQQQAQQLFNQVVSDIQNNRPPAYGPNCDLPNILTILQDLSQFPTLADRVQQGMLNFLYLGRLMVHPQGFNSNPAFQFPDGVVPTGVLDTSRLYYDGNSQGGIIGGSLAAVGVDHDRAVLGVPGMNYSLLLRRSVDFDMYAHGNFAGAETELGLYDNYPNESERPLILSLMQMLWDRAEANGYAHHMTKDPYPNTPPHEVLLHVGFGDHQVADVSAEVEARTIGAGVREPALDPNREPNRIRFFGLPDITEYPYSGSALIFWDIGPLRPKNPPQTCNPDTEDSTEETCEGTPPPPVENVPPRTGIDPHEAPRRMINARQQKSDFLRPGGKVTNPCGLRPCYAGRWNGP